jgi:predicted ATPase
LSINPWSNIQYFPVWFWLVQVRYNESLVDLKIYRVNTDDDVDLSKLSSGEKQIVSLFSKLYFEEFNNLFILFDEPELSLSIEWQKQLLPDIVKSQQCSFLLAVTHSPFIFKNELEKYAIGMNVYVN